MQAAQEKKAANLAKDKAAKFLSDEKNIEKAAKTTGAEIVAGESILLIL